MYNYQGQTNMSSANLYEAPSANNFNTIQQGIPHVFSSATNSQYLTPSQSLPMNEKIAKLILDIRPIILNHYMLHNMLIEWRLHL